MSYERHAKLLTAIFVVLWLALAIHPVSRMDWVLENVLIVIDVPILMAAYRHRLFSRFSHTLIFVFLCLHAIGAHYTYSQVPYDEWWRMLTGHSFNEIFGWQRNHFDRAVHFLYGLLLAYPIREIFLRIVRARGFWGYFLPLDFTMSTSLVYELIEWLAAVVLGGDLGQAYLGTQGDIWDAHKDMALASLGGLIAMLIAAAVNYKYQRDFAREWSDSWRIRARNPDFSAGKPRE
jgi:putative membrane protein